MNSQDVASPAKPRVKPQTPVWKKVLAGIAIFIGFFVFLGAFSATGAAGVIGTMLLGLGLMFPGFWFFLHERREVKPGQQKLKRHWGLVGIASIALLLIGGTLIPTPEGPVETAQDDSETSAV